jgi:hypothetical protein
MGEFEKALQSYKVAIDVGIQAKNEGDVKRSGNNFSRVANKMREKEERLALLEGRGMRFNT